MGWFGSSKDWNIIAIIFEKPTSYRVNGNRGKGAMAEKIRDNVKRHDRTIFWSVFDQKQAHIEQGVGPGAQKIDPAVLRQLKKDFRMNASVLQILDLLEKKETDKASKEMRWHGYPKPKSHGSEEQTDYSED